MKIQAYETRDPAGRQWWVFRGTQDIYKRHIFLQEWVSDAFALPMVKTEWGGVHKGGWEAYQEIYPLIEQVSVDTDAIITGHSRGAWLAAICSLGFNAPNLLCIEGPKPGDAQLATHLRDSVWLHNAPDSVPNLPQGFEFEFAGQQVRLDGPGDFFTPHVSHAIDSVVAGLNKLAGKAA